jgi:hypothetical protein
MFLYKNGKIFSSMMHNSRIENSTFDYSQVFYGDLPASEGVSIRIAEVSVSFSRFLGVTMTKFNTNKIITITENLLKH